MPNMSYCRFQNTLADLYDCYEALEEDPDGEDLSDDERGARERLIRLCADISREYGEEE